MPSTMLITRSNVSIPRSGTSAVTITTTRNGEQIGVQMEFDIVSREEAVAMTSALLLQLKESYGPALVAACIAHYSGKQAKEKALSSR